jgi:selenocysteine lyase/cysteine desulfurase
MQSDRGDAKADISSGHGGALARATDAYENAHKTVARFLGASSSDQIFFVWVATKASCR